MMKANLTVRNTSKLSFHFLPIVTFLAAILSVLFAAQAWGAVSDLRNRAQIKLNDTPSAYNLLELPDEVVSQTQSGLPDLRIYSGEEEIPYALITDQELITSTKYEQAAILNRGTDAQGNLIFEIRIAQDKWINQINFISPDKNFIRKVQVEGSRNQQEWVTLTSGSTIFDLTEEQKDRHVEVNLPQTNFSYLRVTLFNEGKGSFQLEAVELGYVNQISIATEIKERTYALRLDNSKDGIQEYTLDLYQAYLPSRELEIITDAENFNRTVELYASTNNKDWNLVTKGELYSYRLDKLTAKNLILKFRTDLRYLKLKIYNQDNPFLSIQEIKIRGVNPALVFQADHTNECFLYWNSSQIKAPDYDIQRFKQNLDYSKTPRASLGPSEENNSFQFKDTRPWTERNSWLLHLILVLVVAVLLGVIVQSIRKISPGNH